MLDSQAILNLKVFTCGKGRVDQVKIASRSPTKLYTLAGSIELRVKLSRAKTAALRYVASKVLSAMKLFLA